MSAIEEVVHTSFVIQRDLATSPRHAFRFWSEPALKTRWNDCHTDWQVLEESFDFRPGGAELKRWRMPDGPELCVDARYFDIVPAERIIYAYAMSLGGVRLSASLVTVTFAPTGRGTRMTFNEQVVLLSGGAAARAQRLAGTGEGLDRLVHLVDLVDLVDDVAGA